MFSSQTTQTIENESRLMSTEIRNLLSGNLQSVRDRITRSCLRVGRAVDEVTLVAVTKYAELEWVQELIQLGCRELGEARPQQLVARSHSLDAEIRWHLIGHLQRNKAEDLLPIVHQIHSVDSVRLFDHLAKLSQKRERRVSILLEVNVSGELSKDGFDPVELLAVWPQLQTCESVEISGLMTMAPQADQVESARPVFRRLRELRDQMRDAAEGRVLLPELSMGMSNDFEIGIEEGATIIRIGSSLFAGLAADA